MGDKSNSNRRFVVKPSSLFTSKTRETLEIPRQNKKLHQNNMNIDPISTRERNLLPIGVGHQSTSLNVQSKLATGKSKRPTIRRRMDTTERANLFYAIVGNNRLNATPVLENLNSSDDNVFSYSDSGVSDFDFSINASPPTVSKSIRSIGTKIVYDKNKQIGRGSFGTRVYQGKYEGTRDIAVKRILEDCYELVENEIKLLSSSDQHQNVVRYYCNEKDGSNEFRFIALELCNTSLKDWVEQNDKGKLIGNLDNLKILRQCTEGLNYIHSKNVVHRDIKPSNILLKKDGNNVIAKITDFGLGKKMEEGHMSYTHSGRDTGTQGWKAAEIINRSQGDRMNAKVDVFALGCVYYYVLTKGKHPFGDLLRDPTACQNNIRDDHHPEELTIDGDFRGICQLIKMMINIDPVKRPPLSAALNHPIFWNDEKILNFFSEIKPLLFGWEKRKKEYFRKKFEERSWKVLGNGRNWFSSIPKDFLKEILHPRREIGKYEGSLLRDLVNALRNYHAHYDGLSLQIRMEIGSKMEYIQFWLKLFPNLLPYTWETFEFLKNEEGLEHWTYYDRNYDFFPAHNNDF